jgi:hypothetical protein
VIILVVVQLQHPNKISGQVVQYQITVVEQHPSAKLLKCEVWLLQCNKACRDRMALVKHRSREMQDLIKQVMGNLVTLTSAFSTQSYKKEINILFFIFFLEN